jgi:hypothetical protein
MRQRPECSPSSDSRHYDSRFERALTVQFVTQRHEHRPQSAARLRSQDAKPLAIAVAAPTA